MVYLLIFLAEFVFLFILSRILIKLVSHVLLRVTRSDNLAMRLFHFMFIPGVIVHELAHLISAEVMLVRTGRLSFALKPDEDKVVLGSVGIERADPIRRAIIGFAPVFVGILLIAFFVFYFLSSDSPISSPWNFILVFFIVFEVGNTMFSSKKDLEGTFQLLLVISVAIIVGYFLGFKVPDSLFEFLNLEQFVGIVQRGIKVLLFPIGIDLAIILLARFLNKRY